MPDAPTQAIDHERTDHDRIGTLLEEALQLFDGDRVTARRRIEDACAIIRAADEDDRARHGLLASWQMLRAEAYIRDHLDSRLRIGLVAKIVNLSPSYFSRAFKATKGMPYSDYVLAARIALAKRLLLTPDTPIAQIALQCGLADQSHLTRVFSRSVGIPPRAWRCRRLADEREGAGRAFGSSPPVDSHLERAAA